MIRVFRRTRVLRGFLRSSLHRKIPDETYSFTTGVRATTGRGTVLSLTSGVERLVQLDTLMHGLKAVGAFGLVGVSRYHLPGHRVVAID